MLSETKPKAAAVKGKGTEEIDVCDLSAVLR
jgi:hypothetical protein